MTETRIRTRMKVLAGLIVFMFAALTTRLWFLQVLASEDFTRQADQNQLRLVRIDPLRGQVLDREGRVLVANRSSTIVVIDRSNPEFQDNDDAVLFRLSNLLEVPVQDLVDRLGSRKFYPYQPVPVAEDVPKEAVFFIEEHPKQFPGVTYELGAVREYPGGTLASHLLGYVGEVSEAELSQPEFHGYEPGDVVGKAGVEAEYERVLHGRSGIRAIQVNAQGRVLDANFSAGTSPPTAGSNLVLSVDLDIQELAEKSLTLGIQLARRTLDATSGTHLKATGGSIIVMDPKTGRILALASNPTYDPALFTGGLTYREALSLDLCFPKRPCPRPSHNNPLLDRTVLAAYPPGSTFKPFVAGAALRDGFATPSGHYPCPPSYVHPGDTSGVVFNNWTTRDYGYLSLTDALVHSCDTIFYGFGSEWWRQYARSGRSDELMQRELRAMGFGRKSGVDLPSEAAGRVPTEEYKHDLYEANPSVFGEQYFGWLPGDYINMTIGQGFMLTTPMQLAVAYSALANGGTLYAPRLGFKVQTPEGKTTKVIKPQKTGRLPISRRLVTYLRDSLTGVTTRGTASFSFQGFPLDQIPIAGKTGTADLTGKQPFSWFAAMAPANNPKYVVVAMVEQGGHGSTTAAPMVRRILEGLFGLEPTKRLQAGLSVD
jgi:penicillin-binding protein 2